MHSEKIITNLLCSLLIGYESLSLPLEMISESINWLFRVSGERFTEFNIDEPHFVWTDFLSKGEAGSSRKRKNKRAVLSKPLSLCVLGNSFRGRIQKINYLITTRVLKARWVLCVCTFWASSSAPWAGLVSWLPLAPKSGSRPAQYRALIVLTLANSSCGGCGRSVTDHLQLTTARRCLTSSECQVTSTF